MRAVGAPRRHTQRLTHSLTHSSPLDSLIQTINHFKKTADVNKNEVRQKSRVFPPLKGTTSNEGTANNTLCNNNTKNLSKMPKTAKDPFQTKLMDLLNTRVAAQYTAYHKRGPYVGTPDQS